MMNAEVQSNAIEETGHKVRIIEMKRPIPGFVDIIRYSLKAREEGSPFGVLQALDEKGPSFIVVDPFLACPEYEPMIPKREAKMLGIDIPSQASLLAMVTIREEPPHVTVNLRAPLVVNREQNLAAQVVLDDDRWSLRYSIS